jgi:hypothetical protein
MSNEVKIETAEILVKPLFQQVKSPEREGMERMASSHFIKASQ